MLFTFYAAIWKMKQRFKDNHTLFIFFHILRWTKYREPSNISVRCLNWAGHWLVKDNPRIWKNTEGVEILTHITEFQKFNERIFWNFRYLKKRFFRGKELSRLFLYICKYCDAKTIIQSLNSFQPVYFFSCRRVLRRNWY